MPDNATLIKQMRAIQKAGNDVTLRADNARAFILDQIANSTTLAKLPTYFALSTTGQIDKLGVKGRSLKLHQGSSTTPDGTDIADERAVPFTLKSLYLDTWISNSNVFYTAQTRNQDVRQALLSLMQQQFAADVQDLAFNGDEDSSDTFVKMQDGFIKLAKQSGGASFQHLDLASLPSIEDLTGYAAEIKPQWRRAGQYVWFMSQATNAHYVQELQSRQTPLGDTTIVNGNLTNLAGFGVEVVDSMADGVILFTTYNNLVPVVGFKVQLQTAAQDSNAVAKQATYHFMLEDVDFVIREKEMIGIITVAEPESVTVNPTSVSVAVGSTATVAATVLPSTADQTVTYSVADESIATITPKLGKVTGVKAGTTTGTATASNGVSVTFDITVTAAS